MISNYLKKIIYHTTLLCWRNLNWRPVRKSILGDFVWNFSEKLSFERTQIIYVKEFDLLYYAIPKVANSSIKTVLAKNLNLKGNENRKGGLAYLFNNKDESKKLKEKGILISKKKALELKMKGAESFTVIRDPIQRVESFYNTCIASPILMEKLIKFYGVKCFWINMTLREFSDSVSIIPDLIANRHFTSQNKFITLKRKVIVDHIFRIDQVDSHLKAFLHEKGLTFDNLNNVNRGIKQKLSVFDEESIKKLKKRYKLDYKILF